MVKVNNNEGRGDGSDGFSERVRYEIRERNALEKEFLMYRKYEVLHSSSEGLNPSSFNRIGGGDYGDVIIRSNQLKERDIAGLRNRFYEVVGNMNPEGVCWVETPVIDFINGYYVLRGEMRESTEGDTGKENKA